MNYIAVKFNIMKNNLFFLVPLLLLACTASQKMSQPTTEKEINKWYDQEKWLGGLTLKPHESVNKQEFTRQYWAHKAYWDTAFQFLKSQDLPNLAPGKYLLAGDSVYVSVTEGPTKEFDKTQWEAHRKYIDVQYVARGKEKIGVAPVASATVVNPYSDAKDVANFTAEGKFYMAEPGTFFIFFPQDAHRPSIKVEEGTEKKVVIKVAAAP